MFRFATLLRALLCLALLLNGTAYAHAATRMAMGDMAAAAQADDGVPPCHEGMNMDGMDREGEDASPSAQHDDDAGLPDCCKAGNCDGFCAQHAPAVTWLAPLDPPRYPTADAPTYHAGAHASVRLPHRLRPPIPAV